MNDINREARKAREATRRYFGYVIQSRMTGTAID
jgi:hypothetical protein